MSTTLTEPATADPAAEVAAAPVGDPQAVRPGHHAPGDQGQLRQAQPPHDGPQPGHVRGRGRLACSPPSCSSGTSARRRPTRTSSPAWWRCGCGSPCCSPTSPRPWPKAGARRRPPRCARPGPRPWPTSASPTAPSVEKAVAPQLQVGDLCVVVAGRGDPRRRRRGRGHRHRRRVGHHRRVGAGHPRVAAATARRSPAAPGAVRRDRRADHVQAGRDLPRPDDRARRGRRAGRRRRTRSPSTSCSPASRSSSCWRS